MLMNTIKDINLLQDSNVIYFDENSINRSLATAVLKDKGALCVAVATIAELLDSIKKHNSNVLIFNLDTLGTDPQILAKIFKEPDLQKLPLICVGSESLRDQVPDSAIFLPEPLDHFGLLDAVIQIRRMDSLPNFLEAISQETLLSRVGGKLDDAASLLTQFIHEYASYTSLLEEALGRGDKEKTDFLLRNLRSASVTIGADDLFKAVEQFQTAVARGVGDLAPLRIILKGTIMKASELRIELTNRGHAPFSQAEFEQAPDRDSTAQPLPEKNIILAVDDSRVNLDFLSTVLGEEYELLLAMDGDEALQIARGSPRPALILLDVNMPGRNGYDTCQILKDDPRTREIPIIFLTSLSKEKDEEKGLALGAVDYIRKPFSTLVLKARIRAQIELFLHRTYLESLVEERTKALKDTQREVVFRLALAAEYRDNDTGSHIKRIGYLASALAEHLSFPRNQIQNLYFASLTHDVGKIGIPDHILLKPGKLSPEEWLIMKRHPAIGAGLLEGHPSELLRAAARVALSHHEKWDGSGYPAGLAGEDIPIEGRIVAICDVFDALLSKRPYKRAWTYEETLDEINLNSGRHFDPSVVRAFNDVFQDFIQIQDRFTD
ncbi:hypothetical protein MASR2M78_12180 [Treponema sp.]